MFVCYCLCVVVVVVCCCFYVRDDTVISRNAMNKVFCIRYSHCRHDRTSPHRRMRPDPRQLDLWRLGGPGRCGGLCIRARPVSLPGCLNGGQHGARGGLHTHVHPGYRLHWWKRGAHHGCRLCGWVDGALRRGAVLFAICCVFCSVLCRLLHFLYCLVPAVCCICCTVLSLPFVAFSARSFATGGIFCSVPCHLLHFLHGPLPFVEFSVLFFAICLIFCTVLCHLLLFLLGPSVLCHLLHFLYCLFNLFCCCCF